MLGRDPVVPPAPYALEPSAEGPLALPAPG